MRKRVTPFILPLISSLIMPQHQPYTKPHRSVADHVDHLESLGLSIPDPAKAKRAIAEIGYYRLRTYFLSRRTNDPGKPFIPKVSFDEILQIYELDQQLRLECLGICSRVEILFRNTISESLSAKVGSHPYDDSTIFLNPDSHVTLLKRIVEIYQKRKASDPRAKHYFDNYYPPIWTMKDFWTFGEASNFYKALEPLLANAIAKQLGVPDRNCLTSWIALIPDQEI